MKQQIHFKLGGIRRDQTSEIRENLFNIKCLHVQSKNTTLLKYKVVPIFFFLQNYLYSGGEKKSSNHPA